MTMSFCEWSGWEGHWRKGEEEEVAHPRRGHTLDKVILCKAVHLTTAIY